MLSPGIYLAMRFVLWLRLNMLYAQCVNDCKLRLAEIAIALNRSHLWETFNIHFAMALQ